MIEKLAILYSDTYKQCHPRMYPKGLTKLVSYWTPRRSMFGEDDTMIFFGLQGFLEGFLHEEFLNFFYYVSHQDLEEIFTKVLVHHGIEPTEFERVADLHRLGYLPIQIRAIPEGTAVPMGVPCIEITNTHKDFAWVVQWIECILQTELWKPCCHATMARKFKNLANKYYAETSDGDPEMSMSDFGMRGMSGLDEAVKASAAWLTSFRKTSTIPTIFWIENNYKKCPEGVGIGAVSTEHSVMSANYAVDGDELTFFRRMLTELYPQTSFSIVSDTYDYWNVIDNIIPRLKTEILNHEGTMLIRPDSGDIVSISVKTIEKLWDIFGGTTNSKGYKILNPHIRVIYGDGCTLLAIETIWEKLKEKGFAADNIYFGVGAFSFAATMTKDKGLIVHTRDTYGIAMKATFAEIDGKAIPIYKNPATDTSHTKKSHKGCVAVKEIDGKLVAEDGYDHFVPDEETLLRTVYKDDFPVIREDFETIRKRCCQWAKAYF